MPYLSNRVQLSHLVLVGKERLSQTNPHTTLEKYSLTSFNGNTIFSAQNQARWVLATSELAVGLFKCIINNLKKILNWIRG